MESPINSNILGNTSLMVGSLDTIESVILVSLEIFAGIRISGLIRMSRRSVTVPPTILTAPNSIMRSYLALKPVVSKSNTT